MLFKDRADAGKQLSLALQAYKDQKGVVVLGLARGGVVVAYEVATALHLPLDVLVVRKVGAPGNEELAIGAVTESGEGIFNDALMAMLGVPPDYLKKETQRQKQMAHERATLYRQSHATLALKNQTVLLVDDGIATGSSMRVAIQAVRSQGAKKIVLAVPVAASESLSTIAKEVDEVVCLSQPHFFQAVGCFYKTFDQTTDEELIKLLRK
jgi:putative phosphoribosyl transferase